MAGMAVGCAANEEGGIDDGEEWHRGEGGGEMSSGGLWLVSRFSPGES